MRHAQFEHVAVLAVDSGVDEGSVETAEGSERLIDGIADRRLFRNVACASSGESGLLERGGDRLWRAAHDPHVRARASERESSGEPEAARPARHENASPVKR